MIDCPLLEKRPDPKPASAARFIKESGVDIGEVQEILSLIQYLDYQFEVSEKNGVMYLKARYLEPDIITGKPEWQHTRKWQLSEHMVRSEVVQTAFKCVLTSVEHRAREHFLYRGERVFGPHFDIEALVEICRARKLDYRGRKPKV